MKKLDFGQFGTEADDVFGVLWVAFRDAYPRKAVGYEQLKMCNRIGEALQAISVETASQFDVQARVLANGKPLLLPPMEFEKLVSMVKDDQIRWTHIAGPRVERLIGALDAAPSVEVKEVEHGTRKQGES